MLKLKEQERTKELEILPILDIPPALDDDDSFFDEDDLADMFNRASETNLFGEEEEVVTVVAPPYDPVKKIAAILELDDGRTKRDPVTFNPNPVRNMVFNALTRNVLPTTFKGSPLDSDGPVSDLASGILVAESALRHFSIKETVDGASSAEGYFQEVSWNLGTRMQRLLNLELETMEELGLTLLERAGYAFNAASLRYIDLKTGRFFSREKVLDDIEQLTLVTNPTFMKRVGIYYSTLGKRYINARIKKFVSRESARDMLELGGSIRIASELTLEESVQIHGRKRVVERTETYQDVFFEGFHPETSIVADTVAHILTGYEDRLRYVTSFDELADLTTLCLGIGLVTDETTAQALRTYALDHSVDARTLLLRTFATVAQQDGFFQDMKIDDVLSRYEIGLHSRATYTKNMVRELDELRGRTFNFNVLAEQIVTRLEEEKGVVLSLPSIYGEDDFDNFCTRITDFNVPLYEIVSDDTFGALRAQYGKIQYEFEQSDVRAKKARDAVPVGHSSLGEKVLQQLHRKYGLDVEQRQFESYEVYKEQSAELIQVVRGIIQKTLDDVVTVIPKKLGVDVRVKSLGPIKRRIRYLHGGEIHDVPIGSTGTVTGIRKEGTYTTIFVAFDHRTHHTDWYTDPKELEIIASDTIPSELRGVLKEFDGDTERAAASIISSLEQEINYVYREQEFRRINDEHIAQQKVIAAKMSTLFFDNGKRVMRTFRALGIGEYKSRETNTHRVPLGTIGLPERYTGDGFFDVTFPIRDRRGKIHIDEMQLLRKVDVSPRSMIGARAQITQETNEGDYKLGSWGIVTGTDGISLRVQFKHIEGKETQDDLPCVWIRSRYLTLKYDDIEWRKTVNKTTNNLFDSIEQTVRDVQREYKQVQNRKRELVELGVSHFRAIGIEDTIIHILFEDCLTNEDFVTYVNNGLLSSESVFDEIETELDSLGGEEEYSGLATKIKTQVQEKMGLIWSDTTEITGEETYQTFKDTLVESIVQRGYIISKEGTAIPKTIKKRTPVLFVKGYDGIPEGSFGIFKEWCEGVGGNNVHVDGTTNGNNCCIPKNCLVTDVVPLFTLRDNIDDLTKGAYKRGVKVRLRMDSQYAYQHAGVGVLEEDLEGEDTEYYGDVCFEGGYVNAYRIKDLELVNPQDVLQGKQLQLYQKAMQERETRKEEIRRGVESIIQEIERERNQRYQKVHDLSVAVRDELRSFGKTDTEIYEVFEQHISETSYLTYRGILDVA